MEFLILLVGIATGAAAASLVVFGWAASQLRWIAAHCRQHVTYWRTEAERAKATAAWHHEQHVANWYNWPGQRTDNTGE
jgi:hypothetical protein